MRLFIAAHLSLDAREAIQSALNDFPINNPPWRWVSSDNWHLTLKFLGDRDAAQLDSLNAALYEVARRHHRFDLALGAFGGFPNLRNPRVLFYNVERGADALKRLARDVDVAVEAAVGIAPEGREFQAHVTVARVKEALSPDVGTRLARVSPLTGVSSGVHSFELMESRLARTGAMYSVVKEFALA